jgi:lysophospholipase
MAVPADFRRSIPRDALIETVTMADGWALRTFNWPAAGDCNGSILFQTGRGDIFEKYLETFAVWHEAGWDVTTFDWRGQGGSGRLTRNHHVGHVQDFGIWVDDLADFFSRWQAGSTGPHVVMGHSMGGHIVLRALVEGKIEPDGAVLIAPMLGFNAPRAISEFVARCFAAFMPTRVPAWLANEKPSLPGASRQKMLTHDLGRYGDEIWWRTQKPELKLGPPSWQWMAAAYRSIDVVGAAGGLEAIKLPVAIIATDGDRLVSTQAIRTCAGRLPDKSLTIFGKSAAHEILREKDKVRAKALSAIDGLLARVTADQ